ncbi:hypothetical protein NGM10_01370 [Halorussus salilacus]|uniref:DUF7504 family protein n=1 Tax=Halorussus salilacus TaxID=2953750 RepID=UPI00209ED587|nr:hypothetical protein [Halorussus salilacus]USZ68404.1 hypothetical protein NGM10_01370 [Halorussus salilacus]
MSGEERRGSPEATVRFRRRLADLKRNGSNILLVGTDALAAACERLLGESDAGPRYRLFVTADAGPDTARAKLDAVGPRPDRDAAAVVNWGTDVRGGATASDDADVTASDRDSPGPSRGGPPSDGGSPSDGGPKPDDGPKSDGGPTLREVAVEGDDLRDLGVAVEDAIEGFEEGGARISPAELRVCFDSLTPLVEDYGDRDVRRFLLGVTETVERVDGMGHYHLPARYDSEVVGSLSPLFDAVVEVRRADGEIQQRWHLSDPDIATDWLAL